MRTHTNLVQPMIQSTLMM
uniref:Uncharacterized protein n=1 Tax=Anguilla anguilla TaxID=7936 RepID=A0A0E9TPN8_ANGAN